MERGAEGRGGRGEPDCPIFMHVYIVLCIVFDVGRRFVYMWRGLEGPTFSCTCINIVRKTGEEKDVFMHVYIVLCIVFDVGRRFVDMWRGLDGPTFSCTCIYIYILLCTVRGQLRNVEQIQSTRWIESAQHSSADPVQ